MKIGLRAGSGFHYKNPGGLGLRKSGRGLKWTICPTKFEQSRAHEVLSKGGVGLQRRKKDRKFKILRYLSHFISGQKVGHFLS